jgi:hypothetical protein
MRTVILSGLAVIIIALAPHLPMIVQAAPHPATSAPSSQPRVTQAPAAEAVPAPGGMPAGYYVAVDAEAPSQCVTDLLALGWTGDPTDGREAVIAPHSVYVAVCHPLVSA